MRFSIASFTVSSGSGPLSLSLASAFASSPSAWLIAAEVRPDRRYNFMEFCGGHTHAISRYGVPDLLPANVRMIHGPGCPCACCPSAVWIRRSVWRANTA
jgi:hypothetical protein